MNTPTDSVEEFDYIVNHVAPYWSDETFARLAIPQRNAILDELRRREETMEARAEERRRGDWATPAHIRRDFV